MKYNNISPTYLLYQTIIGESDIESLVKTLSLENEKIIITEIIIGQDYKVVNKMLKDLNIPINLNISCIIRQADVIIPNGTTEILADDKLVIVSKKEDFESIINYFQEKVANDAR